MKQSKPNLFEFATSELSQDAFLCWLAAWGDPKNAEQDQKLHCLGQAFLQIALEKHGRQILHIIKPIIIKRQHKNIDVLIIINDTSAICIEDKIGTREHSDQLQRYIEELKNEGFSEDKTKRCTGSSLEGEAQSSIATAPNRKLPETASMYFPSRRWACQARTIRARWLEIQ